MDRICPYLALATDHRSVVDGYDPDHRCHALSPAGELERSRQATLCLVEAHRDCERFLEARHHAAAAAPPGPRPAADAFVPRTRLVLEADGVRRRLSSETLGPSRRRRWLMAGAVGALGVIVVAGAASGGIDGVFGEGPTASPTASGASTVAPSDTARPSASATPAATVTPAPTPAPTPQPTPAPTSTPAPTVRTYVVVANDTLGSIAARFGTTVAAIQAANGLGSSDIINIGQVLIIP